MGPTFTWITTIRCCLDTPVANEGWQELFPNYAVKAQNGPPSDNCSLILVAKKGRTSYRKKKIARFESTWLRHPKFQDEVSIWEKGARRHQNIVQQQIKYTEESLANWNRNEFGHVETMMRNLNEQLATLQMQTASLGVLMRLSGSKLKSWSQNKQELMWRQRSRKEWFQEGDQNIQFFHSFASTGRRNNRLQD